MHLLYSRRVRVSREAQDTLALRSKQRAATAQTRGYFAEETVTITVTDRKVKSVVDKDEQPRAETSLESLSKLQPIHAGGRVLPGMQQVLTMERLRLF